MKKLFTTLTTWIALGAAVPAFAGPDWQVIEQARLLPLYVERSAQWYWRLPVAAALARRVWCGVYNEHFPERVVTFDVSVRDYLRLIGFAMPILVGPWNGVDPAVFHPRAAPPEHGGPLRLVLVGRLVREKNAHLMPDLMRALRAAGVAFELVIVCDGPLGPSLRATLAGAPEVSWRGWQDPSAVAAELARATHTSASATPRASRCPPTRRSPPSVASAAGSPASAIATMATASM